MGLFSKRSATATAGDGGSASPTGGNISGGGMMGSMLRQMIDSGQIKAQGGFGPEMGSTSGTKVALEQLAALGLVDDIFKGEGMKKGGKVKSSSASKRADGCAVRGKTKGKMC